MQTYRLLVDVDKTVVNVLTRCEGWSSVSLGIWHVGFIQFISTKAEGQRNVWLFKMSWIHSWHKPKHWCHLTGCSGPRK